MDWYYSLGGWKFLGGIQDIPVRICTILDRGSKLVMGGVENQKLEFRSFECFFLVGKCNWIMGEYMNLGPILVAIISFIPFALILILTRGI